MGCLIKQEQGKEFWVQMEMKTVKRGSGCLCRKEQGVSIFIQKRKQSRHIITWFNNLITNKTANCLLK